MSRLPLRMRLALLMSAAALVIVSVTGVVLYIRTADELHARLDRSLREEFSEVIPIVLDPDRSLADHRTEFSEDGIEVAQILGPDGQLRDATPGAGGLNLFELGITGVGPRTVTLENVDDPVRAIVVPVTVEGEELIIAVGTSMASTEKTLSDLRRRIALVDLIAVLSVGVAAYAVAALALRPVERMRRQAAEISAGLPGAHLELPVANDELRRLGETFNATISRLQAAVIQRQQFVASASHELRTPLTHLRAGLELARSQTRSPAELEAALDQALVDTDRLVHLTEDLLDLTAISAAGIAIHAEPIALEPLIRKVVAEVDTGATTDVRVEIDDDVVALGDASMLHRLAINLVDNAIRHGAPPIVVHAHSLAGPTSPSPSVELVVADNGPGVPDELREEVLDAFVRAPAARQHSGSGLGLAIVAEIAHRHGGTVELRSTDDQGTGIGPDGGFEVCVVLPGTVAQVSEPPPGLETTGLGPGSALRSALG